MKEALSFSFSKFSGAGNDFILFDNRSQTFPIGNPHLISRLCHRQYGIGADGVILLENSLKADFKMRIFNADGSEAEMCGNGIRCLLKFIQQHGIRGNCFQIETLLKNLKVEWNGSDIAVEMGNPTNMQWDLSVDSWKVHFLDTGVPHAIIFSTDLFHVDLSTWGPKIRFHSLFAPHGANVNFVQIGENDTVHLRTYERGVENETLACGTGATAAALATAKVYGLKAPISIKVRSGDVLKIDFSFKDNQFCHVRMIGPAYHVFDGHIDL